jgi:hypothetical protein
VVKRNTLEPGKEGVHAMAAFAKVLKAGIARTSSLYSGLFVLTHETTVALDIRA